MAEKRLIFTLSPGRCGTGYLACQMTLVSGVRALHEGAPDFVSVMARAQHDPQVAKEFWIKEKLPRITRYQEPIYFESSHLFGKGFVRPLLELGYVPDIVVLTRPHRQVALSFWWRASIPGRTRQGKRYLLDPTMYEGWDKLTRYQLCYWYCLETERRIRRQVQLLTSAGSKMAFTCLRALVTDEGFRDILASLSLETPRGSLKGKMINASRKTRKARYPEGDLDALEDEVREWMI